MRGHPQRQCLGIQNSIAHAIGQRHFRGGDQIAFVFAQLGRKQILLKLGQLPGAAHGIGIHNDRHIGFFVAVRAGMQVQHELRQRTMQTRQLPAQHRKP